MASRLPKTCAPEFLCKTNPSSVLNRICFSCVSVRDSKLKPATACFTVVFTGSQSYFIVRHASYAVLFAVLSAEWQTLSFPSAVIPLCQYTFPVCIKLRPKDNTVFGSHLLPSLVVTPIFSLQSPYSSSRQPPPLSIFASGPALNSDIACANVTVAPQLTHAGFSLSLSFHVW
jgi:hypothetical protein